MSDVVAQLNATWRRPPLIHPIGPAAAAVVLIIAAAKFDSTLGGMIGLFAFIAVVISRLSPSILPWLHPREERGVVATTSSGDWTWNGAVVAKRGKARQAVVAPPTGNAPAPLRVVLYALANVGIGAATPRGRSVTAPTRIATRPRRSRDSPTSSRSR